MARKKKHVPRGAVVDYDDGRKQKFELSTVLSAATGILTTSYSQVQNEESRQPFLAPPEAVPQTMPNVSPKAPGRNQVCCFRVSYKQFC